MFWSISRSNTSRTDRSPSWRRSLGCSCSSGDGCCTDPNWTSCSSWCTNSCTALGPTSPRLPDSRGPRSGEASTDSGLDQGQRDMEEKQARLWKTARRLRRRVPARALHPAHDLLPYYTIKTAKCREVTEIYFNTLTLHELLMSSCSFIHSSMQEITNEKKL